MSRVICFAATDAQQANIIMPSLHDVTASRVILQYIITTVIAPSLFPWRAC